MPEPVLLKLGGSIVTDKRGDCAVDRQGISRCAAILARNGFSGLLIHGAGSCGHPEAQRYGIARGVGRENRGGIAVTHEAVGGLNRALVEALRDAGVEAIGIHPLASCTAEDGRIVSFELEPLQLLLDLGCVPVLHGDVVMDRERGACIVSGDQLVSYLAQRLGFTRIGLVTDVPGVLSGGAVVPRLTRRQARELSIGASSMTDVTGGMAGKIDELLRLANAGISSHIFSLDRLEDFLAGRPHGGTEILPEES
ncbi:MAG TPA: isopentenyl phosphate kinase [Methanoregulaceae archaeon]|nr:isopentenyl phosphate kinase [Methanoregulaceae archaeon]